MTEEKKFETIDYYDYRKPETINKKEKVKKKLYDVLQTIYERGKA